jgi:hypothetical protein
MVVDAPLSGLGVIISGNELAVRIRPIGCLTEVFQRASFFKWHRFIVDDMAHNGERSRIGCALFL